MSKTKAKYAHHTCRVSWNIYYIIVSNIHPGNVKSVLLSLDLAESITISRKVMVFLNTINVSFLSQEYHDELQQI